MANFGNPHFGIPRMGDPAERNRQRRILTKRATHAYVGPVHYSTTLASLLTKAALQKECDRFPIFYWKKPTIPNKNTVPEKN